MKESFCKKCNEGICLRNKDNEIFLNKEITEIMTYSTWILVECHRCGTTNSINGTLSFDSLNNSTLG